MVDVIKIRSFLAANSEKMLENIAIQRHAGKIDTEDLFSCEDEIYSQTIILEKNVPEISKINILLQEKESLGLYVSGNPLDEYKELLQWCRDTSGRDDVYLVLIDKIKKIFTKTNAMMFTLQISAPDLSVEGIIFPKNALNVSSILEEKELYWVQGKIQESKRKTTDSVKVLEEIMEVSDENTTENEIKEFDELPKLIINNINKFEDGVLKLFANEEIPLSVNREVKFKNLDWENLKKSPANITHLSTKNDNYSNDSEIKANNYIKIIRLEKSIGAQKLKQIITDFKKSSFIGGIEVFVEVENSDGFKRAKGSFWVSEEIVKSYGI